MLESIQCNGKNPRNLFKEVTAPLRTSKCVWQDVPEQLQTFNSLLRLRLTWDLTDVCLGVQPLVTISWPIPKQFQPSLGYITQSEPVNLALEDAQGSSMQKAVEEAMEQGITLPRLTRRVATSNFKQEIVA